MPFELEGYNLHKLKYGVAFKTFCGIHELKSNDSVYIELNTQPGQLINCGDIVEFVLANEVSTSCQSNIVARFR